MKPLDPRVEDSHKKTHTASLRDSITKEEKIAVLHVKAPATSRKSRPTAGHHEELRPKES